MEDAKVKNEEKKLKWETVMEKIDTASGLVVRVKRFPIGKPKFDVTLGSLKNGEFSPFISPDMRVEDGKVRLNPALAVAATPLLHEAFFYIQQEAQRLEDVYQQREAELEKLRNQHKLGNHPRVGGKTERERQSGKANRHQQNRSQKADENRSRASRAQGGK